jgi:hypothetical protein
MRLPRRAGDPLSPGTLYLSRCLVVDPVWRDRVDLAAIGAEQRGGRAIELDAPGGRTVFVKDAMGSRRVIGVHQTYHLARRHWSRKQAYSLHHALGLGGTSQAQLPRSPSEKCSAMHLKAELLRSTNFL